MNGKPLCGKFGTKINPLSSAWDLNVISLVVFKSINLGSQPFYP